VRRDVLARAVDPREVGPVVLVRVAEHPFYEVEARSVEVA